MHIGNILGQTTKGQVIEALKALPTGLAESIGFTVERIKSQHPQNKAQATLAMNVLLWLAHAKRPLKVNELQHAVAIRPGETRMDDLTDPEFFVHCCFGLVVIDKETSIVRLVHFTVNEYLQERHLEYFPYANDILTLSCIAYISTYQNLINRSPDRLWSPWSPTAWEEVPFLDYAARFWGFHAGCSVLEDTQHAVHLFCSKTVFNTWRNILLALNRMKSKTAEEVKVLYVNYRSTVLHAAAVYGLDYVMEELLRQGLTVDMLDSENATPLMLAAACGNTNILHRLLAHRDIDVHRVDREGNTALWYATCRGQVQCVQTLLSSRFDLDINSGNPFSLASTKVWRKAQYAEIMSLLLSRCELDANCEYDENSQPPWYNLAIYWELDLLRRLVSRPDFDPWRYTPPVKLW